MLHLAGKGKNLRSAVSLRAQFGKALAAVQDDQGDVGQRLHVVDQSRLSPEPLLGGKGRFRFGVAAGAVKRRNHGCLFAADKSAGAGANFYIEGKIFFEDVLAQEFFFAGLGDGLTAAAQGHRVFCPHIDVAAGRAHGVSGDNHPFQDTVRVSLQDIAVHESPGVSFIGVADDELLVALRSPDHFPLEAGGEAAAAAPAQA